MAKSMRNEIREQSKILKERSSLVRTALNNGCYTRSSIAKATGLKLTDLTNLFEAETELKSEYVVKKKLMATIAADNIFDIIMDSSHKDHFQASKYILANYKTDIDENLEPMGGDLSIELPGSDGDTKDPVVINFSSTRRD